MSMLEGKVPVRADLPTTGLDAEREREVLAARHARRWLNGRYPRS